MRRWVLEWFSIRGIRSRKHLWNYAHGFGEKISLKLARPVLKRKMSFLYYDV
jgi:hypothetical protein